MKKRTLSLLSVLLLSLMIIPAISAVEIRLSKDSASSSSPSLIDQILGGEVVSGSGYQPGELLQAEITGSFISLKHEDILIYEGNKVHSTPVISDLIMKDNIYYYYAILPFNEGNYSIRIENAEYIQQGTIVSDIITKDFKIMATNDSALSINPGFVETSEDFEVIVKSVGGSQEVTAILDGTSETKTVFLAEELEQTLAFSVDGLTESTVLEVGHYNIPIFIIEKIEEEPEVIENVTELMFLPVALTGTITPSHAFKIVLENIGNMNVTDIEISTEANITLGTLNVNLLEPDQQINILVVMASDLKAGQNTSGVITATFDLPDEEEQGQVILPFLFEVVGEEREVEIVPETEIEEVPLSCDDLGGEKCEEDYKCSIDTELSTNGPCCTGKCEKVKTGSSGVTKTIGFLIIGIVIVVIVIMFLRGKKRIRPKSTQQILNEKRGKFSERMMQDRNKNREVSGSLGNI